MIKKILMLVLLMAPLSLCAQKFAYYDHFDVMQSMPAFQTAQKELEELGRTRLFPSVTPIWPVPTACPRTCATVRNRRLTT